MASRLRLKVLEALAVALEATKKAVGVTHVIEWEAYNELRREQAVRLQALMSGALRHLVLACGQAFKERKCGSPKPTEWREAVKRFLQKNPAGNTSTKFLSSDFARYAAKQLVVIFSHIRRLCQNPVKVQNALAALPQDKLSAGRKFIDEIAVFASGGRQMRRRAPSTQKRRRKTAAERGSKQRPGLTAAAAERGSKQRPGLTTDLEARAKHSEALALPPGSGGGDPEMSEAALQEEGEDDTGAELLLEEGEEEEAEPGDDALSHEAEQEGAAAQQDEGEEEELKEDDVLNHDAEPDDVLNHDAEPEPPGKGCEQVKKRRLEPQPSAASDHSWGLSALQEVSSPQEEAEEEKEVAASSLSSQRCLLGAVCHRAASVRSPGPRLIQQDLSSALRHHEAGLR